MSKTLTKGELFDLLGTPQVERQREVLAKYGITPIERPDGSLGVTWEAVNARMLGAAVSVEMDPKVRKLDMSRLHA